MRPIPLLWVSEAPNFEGQCSQYLFDFWPKSDQRISRFVCGLLVQRILRIVMGLFCKNNITSWVGEAATFSIVISKVPTSLSTALPVMMSSYPFCLVGCYSSTRRHVDTALRLESRLHLSCKYSNNRISCAGINPYECERLLALKDG